MANHKLEALRHMIEAIREESHRRADLEADGALLRSGLMTIDDFAARWPDVAARANYAPTRPEEPTR